MDHAHFSAAPFSLDWFAGWFIHIFQFELSRYALAAVGVFVIVNKLFAYALRERKIRAASPARRQLAVELAASVRTCAVFAGIALFSIAGTEAGVLKSYNDPAALGWPWFWASIAVLIVLHDAFFYWTHRLMHHPRLFRRVHRLHHKSHNPSPFTAYAFNTPEAAVHGVFVTLVLIFLPVSQPAIFVFLAHMILRNVIGHSGYELFPARRDGRPVLDWLTTVTHHDLHHAQAGWNYGLYFTWWDRLMKTEHPLYHEKFAEAVRRPLDGSAVRAQKSRRGAVPAAVVAALGAAAAAIAPGELHAQHGAREATSSVSGVWATEGHGAHVELAPCARNAEMLCGKLVWSWDPEIAAKQGEDLMIGDFRWTGEAFDGGWLKNPDDGKTYRGEISIMQRDALRLKGCALVFCKSQVWRRVSEIPGCTIELAPAEPSGD